MNAVLIALFVSTGAPGVESSATPIIKLAGKARQVEAVLSRNQADNVLDLQRPAIHEAGEKKPAFETASAIRPIA